MLSGEYGPAAFELHSLRRAGFGHGSVGQDQKNGRGGLDREAEAEPGGGRDARQCGGRGFNQVQRYDAEASGMNQEIDGA